jgi:hypothetical protein
MFGSSARAAVIRTVVFYTPLFVASLVTVLLILVGVWDLGIVLLIIMVFLAFLFGYQSIQALRDLRSDLRTTRGPITRIWSKMDLIVTRSYYIRVGGNIFRIPIQAYWDLREEAKRLRSAGLEDEYRIEVQVVHYPHTGTVESVERLGQIRVADQPLGEARQ